MKDYVTNPNCVYDAPTWERVWSDIEENVVNDISAVQLDVTKGFVILQMENRKKYHKVIDYVIPQYEARLGIEEDDKKFTLTLRWWQEDEEPFQFAFIK